VLDTDTGIVEPVDDFEAAPLDDARGSRDVAT